VHEAIVAAAPGEKVVLDLGQIGGSDHLALEKARALAPLE